MSSTAPLETIRAGSNQLKGAFDLESHTFAWSVDVKTIAGFNSSLQQEHFNENYMESAKYPKAVFTGKIIEKIPLEQDGIYMVRAKGMLEAHGVARERIIKVKLEIKKQNISIHS
ncbi:MAG: YceI family protein, partial [Bacteroidetes bacterium]|nr:YceI family protein [Bacteroidota bacterium]